MNEKQAYELLGLAEGAQLEEIRQAYRDLTLVWHPDRFGDHPRLRGKAEERLREIIEAHDLLVRRFEKRATPPVWRPASASAAKPGKAREGASPSKPPAFEADFPNILFIGYLVWSLSRFVFGGDLSGFARAVLIPTAFAVAYNAVAAARGRLRLWYIGATVAFALFAAVVPARFGGAPADDWQEHRPAPWSGSGGQGYSGSAPVFPASPSPYEEPAGSGAPRGLYDPVPPAAPVPPAPPAVPSARAQ